MQIALDHVSFSYPDAREALFDDLCVVFPPGWTGIVGNNGCGKTTLARLVAHLLVPDEGTVTPKDFLASYCSQEAFSPPSRLEEFACAWDGTAVRLRLDLGIEDDWAWRFETLSCGQQKRLQVAVSLWEEPDVLVVDEPTNHVDSHCRAMLIKALKGFRGIGLLISHDRELLDQLVERCLCFEGGSVTMRSGTYSESAHQAAQEVKAAQRKRQEAKDEVARIQREAQRRRTEAGKAAAKRSARHLDPKDHDAKERIKLAVYTGKDGVAGKHAVRMDGRLAKAQRVLDEARVAKTYTGDIWMDVSASPRKTLVDLAAGTLMSGAHRLDFPSLVVGNADHIGMRGPNGSGKTTLLASVVEAVPKAIDMLYIPQELDVAEVSKARSCLFEATREERGRILSIVARLRSDPDRLMDGAEMSPGEMRKLLLAQGIVGGATFIIMDEPTNHLDAASIEALERMLASYPGALLLVSHDERLLKATTSLTWALEAIDEDIDAHTLSIIR